MLTNDDLIQLKKLLKPTELNTRYIRKELNNVKKDLSKVRRDLNKVITYFDDEHIELKKKVDTIADYLNVPTR